MSKLKQLFPYTEIQNVKQYYLIQALTNAWFIAGNFYFYYLNFATPSQLGLMFAIGVITKTIFEIPTGYIADKVGNKTITIFGTASTVLSCMVFIFAQNFYWLIAAEILMSLGAASLSGSLQSEIYNTLLSTHTKDLEAKFLKITASSTTLVYISTFLASITGGMLYAVKDNFPFAAFGLVHIVAFMVATTMVDFKPKSTEKDGHKTGAPQIVNVIFNKNMLFILPLAFIVGGVFYSFYFGLLQPAPFEEAGISATATSILLSFSSLSSALISSFIPKLINKYGYRVTITLLSVGMSFGIFGASRLTILGLIPLIIMTDSYHTFSIITSTLVNNNYRGNLRTTINSVASFLPSLFALFTYPIGGYFIQKGQLPQLFLVLACILLAGLAITLLIWPKEGLKVKKS